METSIQTTQTLLANQKFCHGCARPIHQDAAGCPFCGAPQQGGASAVLALQHAGHLAPAVAQVGRVTSDQKFCAKCGTVMHDSAVSCPRCGAQQSGAVGASSKSRNTAILLALFLGGIGGHHFYLGNTFRGLLYLIFCFTFIPAGIALLEGIVFLTMSDAAFAAKYK